MIRAPLQANPVPTESISVQGLLTVDKGASPGGFSPSESVPFPELLTVDKGASPRESGPSESVPLDRGCREFWATVSPPHSKTWIPDIQESLSDRQRAELTRDFTREGRGEIPLRGGPLVGPRHNKVLEPDPVTKAVPARIFALAIEKGWGARRIARDLNDDPAIPAHVKPISEEIVRLVQKNTLHIGALTYGKH